MATLKSQFITNAEAAQSDLSAGNKRGTIRFAGYVSAIITLTGSTAGNDLFELIDIPPGFELIPEKSFVQCAADPGTTLTLDVGYDDSGNGGESTDLDGLADGIVLSSGGRVEFTSGTIPAALTTRVETTKKTRIKATVATANTITNGVQLVFHIAVGSLM